MRSYDDWKAADKAADVAEWVGEQCADAESKLVAALDRASAKVNGQRIGDVGPVKLSVHAGASDDPDELQMGAAVVLKFAVSIGNRGQHGIESIAEILESLADEIRRAVK